MNTTPKPWPWKGRIIYIYLPVVLATLALITADLDNETTPIDVLSIYVVLFLFFLATCALINALVFHAFDLTKWLVKGMKEPQ